jgi:uncharacterized protein (TIGR02145 family)
MLKTLKTEGLILIIISFIFIHGCKKAETFDAVDADGNGYHSLKIGNQLWLKENLKTTKYINGDLIGTTTPIRLDVTGELTPKYQWAYDGNESNVDTYGRLYTWFAATDSRKVCPVGWHVSTDNDWKNLENYLIAEGNNYDSTLVDNKIGKSLASTSLWNKSENDGAIGNTDYQPYRNKSGFTALPGGIRTLSGIFIEMGVSAYWWTGTEIDATFAMLRNMYNSNNFINHIGMPKNTNAMSLRCVAD